MRITRKAAFAAVAATSVLALAACSSGGGSDDATDDAGINTETSINIAWNQPFYSANGNSTTGNATANNVILYLLNSGFWYYDAGPQPGPGRVVRHLREGLRRPAAGQVHVRRHREVVRRHARRPRRPAPRVGRAERQVQQRRGGVRRRGQHHEPGRPGRRCLLRRGLARDGPRRGDARDRRRLHHADLHQAVRGLGDGHLDEPAGARRRAARPRDRGRRRRRPTRSSPPSRTRTSRTSRRSPSRGAPTGTSRRCRPTRTSSSPAARTRSRSSSRSSSSP